MASFTQKAFFSPVDHTDLLLTCLLLSHTYPSSRQVHTATKPTSHYTQDFFKHTDTQPSNFHTQTASRKTNGTAEARSEGMKQIKETQNGVQELERV